jgi:hypothetical protein
MLSRLVGAGPRSGTFHVKHRGRVQKPCQARRVQKSYQPRRMQEPCQIWRMQESRQTCASKNHAESVQARTVPNMVANRGRKSGAARARLCKNYMICTKNRQQTCKNYTVCTKPGQ